MTPRATVIDMFGSSVPIWIFACLAGIGLALLLREVLILTGWQRDIPAPAVLHSSIALIFGILTYQIWIGGY